MSIGTAAYAYTNASRSDERLDRNSAAALVYQIRAVFFFYKNCFYKNVEAEIYQNFKNMLRTYPRPRVGERLYFAHLF